MKKLALAACGAAVVLLAAALPSAAAPNLYGESGLIEVPDDVITPVGTLSLAYHTIVDVGDSNTTVNFFTAGVGILPQLSVSGGIRTNGDTDAIVNAKYRVLPETADRPSVTVGVIDAASEIHPDDPGLYFMIGKNLTAAAEEVAGRESKPLRGYLGFGMGVMKGAFVGLDWTLTPKFSVMFEYLSKGLQDDSHANAGVRFALTEGLKVDAGFWDMKDFTGGISYQLARF